MAPFNWKTDRSIIPVGRMKGLTLREDSHVYVAHYPDHFGDLPEPSKARESTTRLPNWVAQFISRSESSQYGSRTAFLSIFPYGVVGISSMNSTLFGFL